MVVVVVVVAVAPTLALALLSNPVTNTGAGASADVVDDRPLNILLLLLSPLPPLLALPSSAAVVGAVSAEI